MAVAFASAAAGSAALGVYGGVLSSRLDPQALGHWTATNAMLLAFASGAVLVPTAVAGLVYGVRRSAPPAERAFAAFTISLIVMLLFASALIVTNETGRFYERYLIGLFPLIPIAFCAGFRRLPQGGRVAAGVTGRRPSLGYGRPTVRLHGRFRAPGFSVPAGGHGIRAARRVRERLDHSSPLSSRPWCSSGSSPAGGRGGADGLLLLTVAVTLVASVGAVSWDRGRSLYARSSVAASDLRWIDHAHAGPAALLVLPGDPSSSMFDLFWNTSLDRVVLLPGARPIDSFATSQMTIGRFGQLTVGSRALRTAFVVRENWAAIQLSGARRVASGGEATLWVPRGRPAARLLTLGRYSDGWLSGGAELWAYPTRSSDQATVRFAVGLPRGFRPTTLRITVRGTLIRSVRVRPGERIALTLPVDLTTGKALIAIRAARSSLVDGRAVSVQATVPHLIAG